MKKSVFIFDFDGTLADTHQYIIEISNRLSGEFKFNPISSQEISELKNKTTQEVISHLRVPIMKIPAIMARGKREFQKNIDQLKPFGGLKEVLLQLKNIGHDIGILSSNSIENINTLKLSVTNV